MRFGVMVTAVAGIVAGCAAPVRDDVQQRYTERVRELGLTPVYPPREEFQIGDVYVVSWDPAKPEDAQRVMAGRLALALHDAQATLDQQILFLPTNKGSDGKAGTAIQPDLTNGRLTRRGNDRAQSTTLPIAAFPSITADAGFSLNGATPAFGLFAGGRTTVTLDFKDVRTYAFSPALAGASLVRELNLPSSKLQQCNALNLLKASAPAQPADRAEKRQTALYLVTRVYLAREIDYTYRNAKLLALAQKALAASGGTQAGAFNGSTVILNTSGDATGAAAKDLAEAIQTLSSQIGAGGSGAQAAAFSGFGVTLSRTFDRPVTIAYEALKLSLGGYNPCDTNAQLQLDLFSLTSPSAPEPLRVTAVPLPKG